MRFVVLTYFFEFPLQHFNLRTRAAESGRHALKFGPTRVLGLSERKMDKVWVVLRPQKFFLTKLFPLRQVKRKMESLMRSRRASWRRRTERGSDDPPAKSAADQAARDAARASLEASLTEAEVCGERGETADQEVGFNMFSLSPVPR